MGVLYSLLSTKTWHSIFTVSIAFSVSCDAETSTFKQITACLTFVYKERKQCVRVYAYFMLKNTKDEQQQPVRDYTGYSPVQTVVEINSNVRRIITVLLTIGCSFESD